MNRFQFVEDHKDAWGVKRLCEVVDELEAVHQFVSPAKYFAA